MPDPRSPFHAGERAVQARVGVRDQVEPVGQRMLRDAMPDPHRALFAELSFVVLGSLDPGGRPWASIRVGPPGFARSPEPRQLEIGARPLAGDPAAEHLVLGAPVGVLGIQLETRRRNRVNGKIVSRDAGGVTVGVEQSFGNCPKYIQVRALAPVARPAAAIHGEGARLSAAAVALIARADTFFIASASARPDSGDHASEGVDVSHRGGPPGFVAVTEAPGHTVLTWPDFRGNYLFNTLGNLEVNPRAGLLFVDFATGDLLSLTGEVSVRWDREPRTIEVRVVAARRIERAVPLRAQALGRSEG